MSTPNFRFRQFTVWHDRCAMKVGTDGVLTGAWTTLPKGSHLRVLDIGVGSGLIALMIAQRLSEHEQDFHIIGIDIDAAAVQQARENFGLSPWAERLEAETVSLQAYQPTERFDLIVSNPPFFVDSLPCPNPQRNAARHTDILPFETLIKHAERLLAEEGLFSLIAPAEMEERIMTLGAEEGLQTVRVTRFASKPIKPAKRVLMSLMHGRTKEVPVCNTMTMEDDAYKTMVADFYL